MTDRSGAGPDPTSALCALYQAERSDLMAMQALNSAVVTLGVAYAGATIAFLDRDTLSATTGWVVALLPAPLWIVAVFLAIYSTAQARKSAAALALEQLLCEAARLPAVVRRVVGVRGFRSAMEFEEVGAVGKLGLAVVSGGELVLAVGYTALMVSRASTMESDGLVWIGPIALYAALLLLVVTIWINNGRGQRKLRQTMRAHHPHDRHLGAQGGGEVAPDAPGR